MARTVDLDTAERALRQRATLNRLTRQLDADAERCAEALRRPDAPGRATDTGEGLLTLLAVLGIYDRAGLLGADAADLDIDR